MHAHATMNKALKKTVWANIFRLIVPYRKKFLWVVTLGLLSTGASLVEPLIYRTAINDVAGLFVGQARVNAQKDLGVDPGEADSLQSMIRSEVPDSAATAPVSPAVKPPEPHTQSHVAARSPSQALDTLLWAVVWLFVINLVATLFWRLAENTNTRLSCLIEQRFIQNTFAHVLRLPLSFFSRRPSAAIAKQIDQSEEVTGVVNGFSQQILPELISLAGILAIMFWQNVALTAVALITMPVYALIAWHSSKKLESGLADYYSRWEEVSSRIQDGLTGIKTVKLSGSEEREVDRLRTAAGTAYKDYILRAQLSNKYVFWETMLSHLSTALVFGYGGYLTLENRLTPGDVVMFVAYLDRLYGPIDALASLWVELQQNVASLARAFRLLDNGEEEKEGHRLKLTEGRIEFRNVRFSYTPEREVLKGISFTLSPGCVTALVGGSGAGKTTTMDLLMRLYEPASGLILIDGQDISTLDPASVRAQIGVVSTDGAVFRGTLADNIRYKNPNATDDEVWEAAMAAGLHSTLNRLPQGLATPVGESGIGLSVGERQRIQIARMLAAHTRIVVLDEATANLDYATEEEVRRTIDRIRHKATVIIIAHRYSMVRDADQIIVLGEGQVLETGTPAELLGSDGWFARFAAATEQNNAATAEEEDDADVAGAGEADADETAAGEADADEADPDDTVEDE
ncbi:MAG TPA: ABC transporter ATP-binding protein [Puia sp.]|nr:ABC transporter ATP-binding protein [Puia sp.]